MTPIPSTRNYNKDGQVFISQNGLDTINLDFNKNRFLQTSGPDKYFANFDKEYLERGDFYYVTGHHALWILKAVVDIPLSWNPQKTGVTDQTPVAIFFNKGVKEYTITFGELGFLKAFPIDGKGELVQRWNVGIDVFIPVKNMRTNSVAFIPKLTIHGYNNKKDEKPYEVEISIMNGILLKLNSEIPKPNLKPVPEIKSASDKFHDAMKPFVDYNFKFQGIQNWYAEEVKKLNAKANDMPDKKLNQAVEKLTADYNRKLLQLQSEAPVVALPIETTSPNRQPKAKPVSSINAEAIPESLKSEVFIFAVSDPEEAIKIAEKEFLKAYGQESLKRKPYRVYLENKIWIVEGTSSKTEIGGVPRAEISQATGKVINLSHRKQ